MIEIIWNNKYDISNLVSNIEWFTDSESQPGSLVFDLLKSKEVFPTDGDIIQLSVNGVKIFLGRLFKARFKGDIWTITAYDKLRYLKSEDTLVFNASSIDKRFETIMKTLEIPYRILDRSTHNCSAQIADIKSYYSMLDEALVETRDEGGVSFGIRDNMGTIELFKTSRFKLSLILGDSSLVDKDGFEYNRSIEEAANIIKLVRTEDETTRTLRTQTNQAMINKWGGKLQKTQQVDEADSNQAKLVKLSSDLMKKHGKADETITFSSIVGDIRVRAGVVVPIQLSDIKKDIEATVINCTHNFDLDHTMSLEVRL